MYNDNYKLCHYHIFKNAGSSLDAALQKHFGSAWSPFEGTHAHDVLSGDDLHRFIDANPTITAISSHLCRPAASASNVLPIVFIREPLTRARSVYEFTRKDPNQPFREAVKSSFADYLKFVLSGSTAGHVVRNYQVIHLSSASFTKPSIIHASATQANYEEAIQLLNSWPVIGIVDCYAQSIKLIETVYRNNFPKLKLTYEHKNVSQEVKHSSLAKRIKKSFKRCLTWMKPKNEADSLNQLTNSVMKIREEIGEELYHKFCEQNKLDYQLYDFACNRLKKLCEINGIQVRP